jgi:hypothetical protein
MPSGSLTVPYIKQWLNNANAFGIMPSFFGIVEEKGWYLKLKLMMMY